MLDNLRATIGLQFVITMTNNKKDELDNKKNELFKVQAGIFLAVVSGISALIGFSTTLAAAKKQDTKYFNKGAMTTVDLHTTGVSLALRALGWGTFYAVSGTGLLAYGIWKLSGAKDLAEFRQKMGSALPRISKESHERSDFNSLTDLLEYLQTRK